MDHGTRERWRRLWHGTIWEIVDGDGWLPLSATSAAPMLVISAWNAHGMAMPLAVNRSRDALLRDELSLRGLQPRRARGSSSDRAWSEDGWMVEHRAGLSPMLLQRYQQLAGLLVRDGRHHVLWWDGRSDPG